MSESPPTEAPDVPPRKGYAWLAWIVIVLAILAIIGGRLWMERFSPEAQDGPTSRSQTVVLELQSRYIIGAYHLLGPLAQGLDTEIEKLNHGGIDQRLRAIVLIGEISGPDAALDRLHELDDLCEKHHRRWTNEQQRTRDILRTAYTDFAEGKFNLPSVNDADQASLVENLHWFGTLALNPRQGDEAARAEALRPAWVTVLTMAGAISLAGVFVCVGLICGIVFAVLAWNGSVNWRFQIGIPHGGVYAETFALWLIVFFGANVAISFLPFEIPRITQAIVVMLASLLVLAWPVVRGIPWSQVRQDIGLIRVGNPVTEITAGIWCYVVNLPLVAIGFGMTVAMLLLYAKLQTPEEGNIENFSNESLPHHPIIQHLADGDWTMRGQIFFLACIVAPLVEETMFRGVLHRHCRELTGGWSTTVSALFSTTVVSFVFAAIHPQGLMVIPPLMFMAFGFSLAREWRVSLLPSMFAHGMSNGFVLTVATIALSR